MRVVVLFICLCSLLLKGNAYMLAGFQANGSSYAYHPPHPGCSRHSNYTHNNQDNSLLADPNLEAEPDIVLDEDDDEDNHNVAAEKFRLLARSHATHAYPAYPAILNYLCNCYKVTPSVCIPATDKYILQGVLRI